MGKPGERAAVPQRTKPDGRGGWESVFWRIPVHCPLPNHVVVKSAKTLPIGRWEFRRFDARVVAGAS
jgi:hypothetical protein